MTYEPPPPPPQSDYFRASDHEGALMVFRVKEYDERYSGWTETQPAVRCDIEAIEPAAGPWYDAWVGNELIVGQLRASIGKTFFCRLMRRGRAFILDAVTYGDEARIESWRQRKKPAEQATPPPPPPPASAARSSDDIPF